MDRLPELESNDQPETLTAYGLRVLAFVLREQVTATLDDHALETADHFYPVAVAAPGLTLTVLDRLADARRMIQAAIRGREADRKEAAQEAPGAPSEYPQGAPGTSKVPLAPLPKVNPPGGAYAEIQAPRRPVEINF